MSWTVAGAVDYKGFPANKSRTGGWEAAALILGKYMYMHAFIFMVAEFLPPPLIVAVPVNSKFLCMKVIIFDRSEKDHERYWLAES